MYSHSQQPLDRLQTQAVLCTRLGWALFAQMAAMLLVQLGLGLAADALLPGWRTLPWALWLLSVGSAYGVGVPAFCLMLLGTRGKPRGAARPLSPPAFVKWLIIALGVVYAANLFTLILTHWIGLLLGRPVTNPVDSMADYPIVLNFLLGCVIAPLAEEFLFRGLLLNRLLPLGERFAIVASALCFGLFHGNVNQFFYAFGVGVVLACVARITCCLRQSILLHAAINFTSVGLVPFLSAFGQPGAYLLSLLVYGSIGIGMILLPQALRTLTLSKESLPLSSRQKWQLCFVNPGMVSFCLLSLILMYLYLT